MTTEGNAPVTSGSCLCGGVKFQINGPLNGVQACHCRQCRKAQGTPFATNLPVDRQHFLILQGDDLLREFQSLTREGKYRVFCSQCGSPVFSRLDANPDVLRVRAGALDEPVATDLVWHQFVAHKASWWDIADGLPQYDEYPPK